MPQQCMYEAQLQTKSNLPIPAIDIRHGNYDG